MRRSISKSVLVTTWNPTEIKHRCSKTAIYKTFFSERLRLYTVRSSMTLTAIHDDIGVDHTTFTSWIYRGVKPRFGNLIKICKHLAKFENKTFAQIYNELNPLWRENEK